MSDPPSGERRAKRRQGAWMVGAGVALIGLSWILALVTAGLGWGGVSQMSVVGQLLSFSPAIATFVAGVILGFRGVRRLSHKVLFDR